jgi:hypothetical protein
MKCPHVLRYDMPNLQELLALAGAGEALVSVDNEGDGAP